MSPEKKPTLPDVTMVLDSDPVNRPNFKVIAARMIDEEMKVRLKKKADYSSLYRAIRRRGRLLWSLQVGEGELICRVRRPGEKKNPFPVEVEKKYRQPYTEWRVLCRKLKEGCEVLMENEARAQKLVDNFHKLESPKAKFSLKPSPNGVVVKKV